MDAFTAREWDVLKNTSVAHGLDMLLYKVVKLGGRRLTEARKKQLMCFIFAATNSQGMSPAAKKCLRTQLSGKFKGICRNSKDPNVSFDILPSPRALKESFPEFCAQCFPNDPLQKNRDCCSDRF